MPRRALLILAVALLPVLCACDAVSGEAGGAVESEPPSRESLGALIDGETGPSREGLARAIDAVFAEEVGETRALIVVRGGRIVAERYAPGFAPETRHIGWSLTKSVTGVLIGMLIADGKLALDAPAPVPRWQRTGDPRAAITVRQLLQMRSGLRHVETDEPAYAADTAQMLFLQGRDDMAHFAETQPLDADPGTKWAYSTATSVILADIATRALIKSDSPGDRRQAMSGYLRERLFDPVGMDSAFAEFDAQGTFVGGSMIHATARDWAKFGEMLRTGGKAPNGVQVVPKNWLDFMRTPSPADSAYGAHLWLNRQRPQGRNPILFPGEAPDSVFAMLGLGGQYVIVSPEQELTVVRLGASDDTGQEQLNVELGRLLARFPVNR